jgi:3-hydroxyisobutyrate dehydrogenase-like beta-hydroxyacid dehydrogenase
VWDEHDVAEVLQGESGVFAQLRSGGVVVVHSTVSPEACARLAADARARGFGLVDAPVSVGNSVPKLLVMVGGDVASVERCQPVLDAIGQPVLHLGPIGSGQIAKLMNNCTVAAQIGLGADAVALGVDLGLDQESLVAALSTGSASGLWAHLLADHLSNSAAAPASASGRTAQWARKDVDLAVEVARRAGIEPDRLVLRAGGRGAELLDPGPSGG